jgi:hypothetical protein
MQQPADFFRKEIEPGQHRLEDPFRRPCASTNIRESKPQQTGTGLLIRYGEVATTSGSTNLIYCRVVQ